MASCKDCVHVEACKNFANMILDAFDVSVDDAQCLLEKCTGDATVCNDFADRSRFVELPSDGVMYGVLNGKPIELSNYISPPKGKELFILSPKTVNVPFFKSKEEAEQALKERETDGKK